MSGTRAISTSPKRELSSSFFFFLQGKAPKEIHAILTETLACFLPGRAKDLSAPLYKVDCVWNVMTHAQKPYFDFRRNGRIHLNRHGASVQSTTGSRGVRISGSNAGYTMFRGSMKGTGYPLHSTVSPSPPLPCVTVCHHISNGLYTPKSAEKQLLAVGWMSHVRFAALCVACTTPPSYAVDTGDPLAGGKLITSLQLMPRLWMCGFICGFFNNAASNGGMITTERT